MKKTVMYNKKEYDRLSNLSNQVHVGVLSLCAERLCIGYIISDGKVAGHEEDVTGVWNRFKCMLARIWDKR